MFMAQRNPLFGKDTAMRGHGLHMWMCAGMVVVALVAVLVSGSAFFILPALGCVLMMGGMMWMMMDGMRGHGGDSDRSGRS
jgi:hypothetical protein